MKDLNPRHEKFCHLLLDGTKSWRTIMQEMGYKENQSQFSSLKNSPKIQKRLAQLQSEQVTDAVMSLSERLELLTAWIRDPNQTKGFRLQCLRELSEQDGSKVKNLNVNSTTSNTIRYVDVELPKKENDGKRGDDGAINEHALEGLEQFLMDASNSDDVEDLF